MFSVTVIRPSGFAVEVWAPERADLGDIIAREERRGSEVVSVTFPEDR